MASILFYSDENITLVEDSNVITDDKSIAENFNLFFGNIIDTLGIKPYKEGTQNTDSIDDPVLKAIFKYKNHPSIIKIKQHIPEPKTFSFHNVSKVEIEKQINLLDKSKAQQQTDIPTRIIKDNTDIFATYISQNFDFELKNSNFPDFLKNADIKPVHKKNSRTEKSNYRPVSILPNLSKIYERCIYEELDEFFQSVFSKYQFGFRKGHNAQQCLISMIEKWKKCLDKDGTFGALLTDLSKAFDCIPHDLLIAKLNAYGFDRQSLKFLNSYLTNRKQRVKINNEFSDWTEIIYGVPQGSILGPILFNIFLCDLFLFIPNTNVASYADDNTPYCTGSNVDDVLCELQNTSEIMFSWFINNGMKANPEKSHLILSAPNVKETKICNETITSTNCVKLLGVNIDNKLTFDEHVDSLCKKASQK